MESTKTKSIFKGSCPISRENWENKENKGFLDDLCEMLLAIYFLKFPLNNSWSLHHGTSTMNHNILTMSMHIHLKSWQRFGRIFSSWKVGYPEGADSRGLLTFKEVFVSWVELRLQSWKCTGCLPHRWSVFVKEILPKKSVWLRSVIKCGF